MHDRLGGDVAGAHVLGEGALDDLTNLVRGEFHKRMATLPPFQELLDEHGRDVLGFLVASVGPHDAEDCFQETFIAALRGYPKLKHADNLRSWLLTIAHRKAIDHHRARGRGALPSGSAEEVGGGLGAEDRALESAGEGEVWQLVSVLPPKQRSAVVLQVRDRHGLRADRRDARHLGGGGATQRPRRTEEAER